MSRLLRWGQGVVNQIATGNIIVNSIGGTATPPPPIHIVDIVREEQGTCETTQDTPTCTSTSKYFVQGDAYTPPVTLLWSVTAPATITSGQGTNELYVSIDSADPATYDVTVIATDISGSDTMTKTFTDLRTAEPPITITSITRTSGGTCEYPTGGSCASTSIYDVAVSNATGTVTYNWTVTGNAVIDAGQGTSSIEVLTGQTDTPVTYNVSCTVTDDNSTDTEAQDFTDTRTAGLQPIVLFSTNSTQRTIDNGVSWQPINPVIVSRAAKSANTFGTCQFSSVGLRSTDGGSTYADTTFRNAFGSNGPYDISTNGTTWITVGSGGQASISTDDSASWTLLSPLGLNSGSATATFRSIRSNGTTWVAGANSGYASRSTDDGVTWTALPPGLNCGDPAAGCYGLANNGDTWVSVHLFGWASRSTDNGVTWTALPRALDCAANPNWARIVANGSVFIAVGNNGYASRSTDNGVTWTALPIGLNNGLTSIIALINQGNVWMAFGTNVSSRSTDNGATWTGFSTPTGSATVQGVA